MCSVNFRREQQTGQTPAELLRALYNAYQASPAYEDFALPPDANVHNVIFQLWNRLLAQRPEANVEMGVFSHFDCGLSVGVTEIMPVSDMLTFPLKALVTSKKIDRPLREVLLSLVHYLVTDNGVPDWRVAIDYAQNIVSDYSGDDENEEAGHIQDLEDNMDVYYNGEANKWLQKIAYMKPWPLEKICAFKTKNRRVKKIIAAALEVIEHTLSFTDYVVLDHHDHGLHPEAYIFIAWDYNQPIESFYLDEISMYLDNCDLSPPVCVYPLRKPQDWAFNFHGDSFFGPLRIYFDEMLKFLK